MMYGTNYTSSYFQNYKCTWIDSIQNNLHISKQYASLRASALDNNCHTIFITSFCGYNFTKGTPELTDLITNTIIWALEAGNYTNIICWIREDQSKLLEILQKKGFIKHGKSFKNKRTGNTIQEYICNLTKAYKQIQKEKNEPNTGS